MIRGHGMKGPLALGLGAVIGAGCAHEHIVTTLRPISYSGDATATLVDGNAVRVRAAETFDGAQWILVNAADGAGPAGWVVDSSRIQSYATVNHGRGLLEGLALGGLGGGALGAAIGYASGDDSCPNGCWIHFSAGAKAVIGGIAFGALGLVGGAVAGTIIGSRDVYRLDESRGPRLSAHLGPGGAGGVLSWSF